MEKYNAPETDMPIDAVIAWVDGSDPQLAEKRRFYLKKDDDDNNTSKVLSTHFASNNEISFCVLSILKFAPFIRNIFIVTDNQDPNIYEKVRSMFPERTDSIRIVDHKEIFEGFEEYLPTFNSISIGNMIWRIKGLSDNFVYFNDDVFLIREAKPQDWFIGNRPVLRGKWKIPPYKRMLKYRLRAAMINLFRRNETYHPRLSFYGLQWKVARFLGFRWRYFFLCHTPHPLNRKRLEEFFNDNRELMENNISYRFRSSDQLLMSSLAYHLEILDGNRQFARLNLGYLHPTYSHRRLARKIRYCEKSNNILSVCVQSLDMMEKEQRENIFNWMKRILNVNDLNREN